MKMPRFDLFSLLELTAVIGFAFAVTIGAGGTVFSTSRFASLPSDDAALIAWLAAQDRRDVRVERHGDTIRLAGSVSLFDTGSAFESLPQVPWTELGYTAPQTISGAMHWTTFNGSPYVWGFGIAILAGLHWFRRRYVKPRAPPVLPPAAP